MTGGAAPRWTVRRERHGDWYVWVVRNRLGCFYSGHTAHPAALRSANAGARLPRPGGTPR